MRKKDEHLHETLLECARGLLAEKGPQAVNMREIARRAGVATGTVYNYFSSKEDILMALTEAYWQDTLEELRRLPASGPFYGQLAGVFHFLRGRVAGQAGMLMGSLGRAETAGRQRMQAMQTGLWNELHRRLLADEALPPGLWKKGFTAVQATDFVLTNLVAALRSGAENVEYLEEVLRRVLYCGQAPAE